MKKFIPFLLASVAVHMCGFVALATFNPALPGSAGDPNGDPDRVFVDVISDQDLIAVAPTPSPEDSPAAVESEKAKEQVPPEASPELLARERPETPAEFSHTTLEETPDPESQTKEQEKAKEKKQEESAASTPQVASSLNLRRAALGSELRDFHSLMLAAIRRCTYFPQDALKDKRHGQVTVAFTIDKEGKLAKVEVVETSGCDALDHAALEIMRKASEKFPALPPSVNRDSLNYTVPIRFKEKSG